MIYSPTMEIAPQQAVRTSGPGSSRCIIVGLLGTKYVTTDSLQHWEVQILHIFTSHTL